MTLWRKFTVLTVIVLAGVLGFVLAGAEADPIQITMKSFIHAGDALQVTVQINSADAGDTATITLANGLNFIDETVVLGTGGIAVWQIEENIVTQAGTSMLVVQYGDIVERQSLLVLPLQTDYMDLFSSANNIESYGEDSTTVMMLPEDRWGNTPIHTDDYTITIIYPDTSRVSGEFELLGGMGLYTLTSAGIPGRLRIEALANDVMAQLELMQIPSTADNIDLSLNPACVLNDGRDLVTISMDVTDAYGQAVTDGTLLTVRWEEGLGYARTIDGVATLRLPAFSVVGEYGFYAQVGDVTSSDVILRVVEESCLE